MYCNVITKHIHKFGLNYNIRIKIKIYFKKYLTGSYNYIYLKVVNF